MYTQDHLNSISSIVKLQGILEATEKHLAEVQTSLENIELSIAKNKEKSITEEREANDRLAILSDKVKNATLELENIQNEVDKKNHSILLCLDKVKQLENDIIHLEDKRNTLECQIIENRTNLDYQNEEIAKNREEMKETRKNTEAVKREIENLKAEKVNLELERIEIEKKNEELRGMAEVRDRAVANFVKTVKKFCEQNYIEYKLPDIINY